MTIVDFRDTCSTLGRFASVREKAPEPQDRIVVQVRGGRLKLVAGTDTSVVVADCGPATGDGKAVVSSRLLLSASKALRGRGDVEVALGPTGVDLGVTTGGAVRLERLTLNLPRYPRAGAASGSARHAGLAVFARLLPASVGPRAPRVYFSASDGSLKVVATDGVQYVQSSLPASGTLDAAGIDPAFIAALADFEEPGDITWSERTLTVTSGRFTATTEYAERGWFPPEPPARHGDARVLSSTDRKALIEACRGLAPTDEHKRVVLTVDSLGAQLTDWAGTSGSVAIGGTFEGSGRVAFDAGRLGKLLRSLPDKAVRLQWETGVVSPIRLRGEEDEWLVLLAPVI